MDEDVDEILLTNILKDFGMAIPSELTSQGFLKDLEERLGDFARLEGFMSTTRIENLVNEDACRELFKRTKGLEAEISAKVTLTGGEDWTLNFLKGVNESDFIAFVKLVGPLYYAFRVANDMDKILDSLTNNIKAALFIYLFQNLYELLMGNIDACIYVYLNKNALAMGQSINYYRKEYIEKRKLKRSQREDVGEHATAGLIYGILKEVYEKECFDAGKTVDTALWSNTIFNTMTERLRNMSAHFNAFYDDKINKIVFLNGEKLSMQDFLALYQRLFLFLYRWMDLYISGAKDEDAFIAKMKDEITKMLRVSSRLMLQINRSGKQKYWNIFIQERWGSKVVKFNEEEEDRTIQGQTS